jgi:hypothetical protein
MLDVHCIKRLTANSLLLKYQQEAVSSWPNSPLCTYHIVAEDKTLGFAKQRAAAFALGTGEYVSSVDDDDRLNGQLALEMFDYVNKHKPLFIQSGRIIINREGVQTGRFSDASVACTLQTVLAGKATVSQLAIVRRDLALEACDKALGFLSTLSDDYIGTFDLVYYLELLKMTKCERYPFPVYQWRHHGLGQYHQQVFRHFDNVIHMYSKTNYAYAIKSPLGPTA